MDHYYWKQNYNVILKSFCDVIDIKLQNLTGIDMTWNKHSPLTTTVLTWAKF